VGLYWAQIIWAISVFDCPRDEREKQVKQEAIGYPGLRSFSPIHG